MSTPKDTGSTVALGKANVLSFYLSRPAVGNWTLEAEIDSEPAPNGGKVPPMPLGTQRLTFARAGLPELPYVCTVVEARAHIGRGTVWAVGGAGGLRERLTQADGSTAGIDYANVSPRLLVEDICRDAHPAGTAGAPDLSRKETPSPVALAALSALAPLTRWSRPAGTGAAALTRLVERLAKLDGKPWTWRVLRTGEVWVGVETWPAYRADGRPKTDPPYYTAEPGAAGIGVLALDAPDLDPGVTIPAPEDQGGTLRIGAVVHLLTEDGAFRTRVQVARTVPGQGRTREDMRRAVEGVLPPLDLRVPWYGVVASQDDDGRLGVRLEDGAPVLTLSGIPLYTGIPGCTSATIPPGTRVLVEFVGGREDAPVVRSFGLDVCGGITVDETGAISIGPSAIRVSLGTGQRIGHPVARVTDLVCRLALDPTSLVLYVSHGAAPTNYIPVAVTVGPPPGVFPGTDVPISTGSGVTYSG